MRQNQQLIALPNVLRDQPVPNRLGKLGPAPIETSRVRLPWRSLAILLGFAVAATLILIGRLA
jgi:hypothetical protein